MSGWLETAMSSDTVTRRYRSVFQVPNAAIGAGILLLESREGLRRSLLGRACDPDLLAMSYLHRVYVI
jgi:hypothetical protein